MKNFKKFFFITLTTIFLSTTGWNNFQYHSQSDKITSFYYYKNQPFNLTLKSDRLFIKLNKEMAQADFLEMIQLEFSARLNSVHNYVPEDRKYFIDLIMPLSETAILQLINASRSNSDIQYVSPVFSPDNGKTLIGVEDEVIVQFKSDVSTIEASRFIIERNLNIIQEVNLSGGLTYVLRVPSNVSAIDVANEIHHTGKVNWSEPNLLFTNLLCYDPNDPFYPMQWSLKNLGNNIPGGISGTADCDMDVDSAWNTSLGISQCRIAISDTGVDTLHEDLVSNMLVGSGWNFWNNTPNAWDDNGHGTACAGISAAIGNNSLGVSGVAPNCKIIPVKWLSSGGSGNYTGASNATIWAYQRGAWVISNSWGFVGGASSMLDNAISDAVTFGRGGKGSLFVVASGNENGAMRFPASTNPNCLVVGGISPCNQRKSPSSCDLESWGASFGSNLDVVAPCVKVYTTDRTGSPGYSTGNYFATFNGTSSATPNVAGVCALAFSLDSTMRWDTLRVRVARTCEKRGSYTYNQPGPRGIGQWNNEMGYGLVNARLLLASLNPPPPSILNRALLLPTPGVNTHYVMIPHQASMIGFNNITIEAWVKIGSSTNANTVLNKGAASFDYQLGINASTTNPFFRAQSTIVIATGVTITQGVWTHLAVTYDGTTVRFYKDGALAFQQVQALTLGSSSNEMRIGRGNNDPGSGHIEELRLWTVARTQGQIDSNRCRKYPVQFTSTTGLRALWHFDSTYTDSVSGYNGTPTTSSVGFDTVSFPIPGAGCNLVSVQPVTELIPSAYSLEQNYPNPFNPVTSIRFSIPRDNFVEIIVYDITGREVATLIRDPFTAGTYVIDFDGSSLASGVYFYKMTAGDFSEIRKMVLIK